MLNVKYLTNEYKKYREYREQAQVASVQHIRFRCYSICVIISAAFRIYSERRTPIVTNKTNGNSEFEKLHQDRLEYRCSYFKVKITRCQKIGE